MISILHKVQLKLMGMSSVLVILMGKKNKILTVYPHRGMNVGHISLKTTDVNLAQEEKPVDQ